MLSGAMHRCLSPWLTSWPHTSSSTTRTKTIAAGGGTVRNNIKLLFISLALLSIAIWYQTMGMKGFVVSLLGGTLIYETARLSGMLGKSKGARQAEIAQRIDDLKADQQAYKGTEPFDGRPETLFKVIEIFVRLAEFIEDERIITVEDNGYPRPAPVYDIEYENYLQASRLVENKSTFLSEYAAFHLSKVRAIFHCALKRLCGDGILPDGLSVKARERIAQFESIKTVVAKHIADPKGDLEAQHQAVYTDTHGDDTPRMYQILLTHQQMRQWPQDLHQLVISYLGGFKKMRAIVNLFLWEKIGFVRPKSLVAYIKNKKTRDLGSPLIPVVDNFIYRADILKVAEKIGLSQRDIYKVTLLRDIPPIPVDHRFYVDDVDHPPRLGIHLNADATVTSVESQRNHDPAYPIASR